MEEESKQDEKRSDSGVGGVAHQSMEKEGEDLAEDQQHQQQTNAQHSYTGSVEDQQQEIEHLISPSKSLSLSPEEQLSTAKKLDAKPSPAQHPLSVYFRSGDQAEPEAATPTAAAQDGGDDLRLTQSPTSFGQEAGSPSPSDGYRRSEGTPTSAQIVSDYRANQDVMRNVDQRLSSTLSPTGDAEESKGRGDLQVHAAEYQHHPKHSGLQSVFGSIEQSPQARNATLQFDGNQTHPRTQSTGFKSPRSQQLESQRRQGSDQGSSSQQQQSYANPADNYQFLGGIREVDDDQESLSRSGLGGTIGSQTKERTGFGSGGAASSGEAATGPHFFQGSLRDSMRGSQRDAREATEPLTDAGNLYGSVRTKPNPFATTGNGHQPGQWSSGKSRDSDYPLSFGGGFGAGEQTIPGDGEAMTPPRLTHGQRGGSQGQESEGTSGKYRSGEQYLEHGHYGNQNLLENMLNRVYNQGLAQMGEKACMRLALKELVVLLDELNQSMCKQSVQQDIVLSEDTPTSQMRQIMDLSMSQQRNSAQRAHKPSDDPSDDPIPGADSERLQALRRKSNLQLIESIRMDSKMMNIRFADFLTKENNIYTRLAKERERNQMLQAELHAYESAAGHSPGSAGRDQEDGYRAGPSAEGKRQVAFSSLGNQALNYQRDTIEVDLQGQNNSGQARSPDKNSQRQGPQGNSGDNLTIDQLSPGSPFQVGRSPVQQDSASKSAPSYVQTEQEQHPNQAKDASDDAEHYNLALSRDLLRQLDEKDKQIKQLNQYVEAMKKEFDLYRLSSSQRLVLETSKSVGEYANEERKATDFALEQAQKEREKMVELHTEVYQLKRQNAALEDQLRASTKWLSHGSPNIKVRDDLEELRRQGYDGSGVTEHLKHLNSDSSSKQNWREKDSVAMSPSYVNSASLTIQNEAPLPILPEQQRSRATDGPSSQTQAHEASLHIGEAQSQMNQGQVISEHRQVIEALHQKLQIQTRMNQRLEQQERQLILQLRDKVHQLAETRSVIADLKNQGVINSEALEKAGKVIQKLNTDYQKSLEAATVIQEANQKLKDDNMHSRQQLENNQRMMKQREQAMESRNQRIDNELNLEVNELKEALSQYKQNAAEEKRDWQSHISDLKGQISRLTDIQTSLEAKLQAEQKEANTSLGRKNMEVLDLHDQNLSLKIEMESLKKQLEQDVQVKDDLHRQQLFYFKNQINDLQQQLNSKTQNRYFPNENTTQSTVDYDVEQVPQVNGAYLSQLNQEFQNISEELVKVRAALKEESTASLDSFLSKHIDTFNEFKLSVLDGLLDWHKKTKELSGLASKYYETLEQYKMNFIQMKQLIKQKDAMVRSMHAQLIASQEVRQGHFDCIRENITQCNETVTQDFKKNNELLTLKIKVKDAECEQLIKYQEEFREEYIKVCDQRDEHLASNKQLQRRYDDLDLEHRSMKQAGFEYKEKLRKVLDIVEGPHCHEVVAQHCEMIMEERQTQKIQITHFQEKTNELTLELEAQRTLFQQKMSELENQLDEAQKQYLKRSDEAQEEFMIKEHDLENKVSDLQSQLQISNQEIQLKERQFQKHTLKIDAEIQKQVELQNQIEAVIKEREQAEASNKAVKESYETIEQKLKQTEQLLDSKHGQEHEQIRKLKEQITKNNQLENEIDNMREELRNKTELCEQVGRELNKATEELRRAQDSLNNLNIANAQLTKDLTKSRSEEERLDKESRKHLQNLQILEGQTSRDGNSIASLQQEVRRYQDSLAYLSRQVDEGKIKQLDFAILQKEIEALNGLVNEKDKIIDDLNAKYVNRRKQTISVQTDYSTMTQIEGQHAEILNLNHFVNSQTEEIDHLKEAMRRQLDDIDGLIEEKRQLEAEIEQKNQKIMQTLQTTNENVNLSNYNQLRQRSNSPGNSMRLSQFVNNRQKGDGLEGLQQVLAEKEKYISKLSNELNELRKENEKLKDKLIVLELENLGTGQYAPGLSRTPKLSTDAKGRAYQSNNHTQATLAGSGINQIVNMETQGTGTQHFGFTQQQWNQTGGAFGGTTYGYSTNKDPMQMAHQDRDSQQYHDTNSFRHDRRYKNRLISPGKQQELQYMTQNIKVQNVATPILGSQNCTNEKSQLDESQFYTLQQTQPINMGNMQNESSISIQRHAGPHENHQVQPLRSNSNEHSSAPALTNHRSLNLTGGEDRHIHQYQQRQRDHSGNFREISPPTREVKASEWNKDSSHNVTRDYQHNTSSSVALHDQHQPNYNSSYIDEQNEYPSRIFERQGVNSRQ